jgi:cytochrome c-type biogenesis protein CcmH
MLPAFANEAAPAAADPVLEARMTRITAELRCLVCQNQTIADSHADLAVDLRQEVRELIQRGRTDDQIRRYMTDRYGDFVLYKPPFKASTAVLWLGPGLLLAVALVALIVTIARRRQLADDQFEPDPDWGEDDPIDAATIALPTTTARTGTPA